MLFHLLVSLTFWVSVSCTSAEESQCDSLILKNITDETQSSIILSLLNNAKSLLDDAKKYASIKTGVSAVETVCDKPMDCAEVKKKNADSGVYKIWPRNRVVSGPVEVYCDMQDDGGAWTVLQRRGEFDSSSNYFSKDWRSYKKGFGDPAKDYWIGNDIIFALTNQRSNVLKIVLSDWERNQTYATYDEFWIDDEFHNYTLHVSGYRGTAGDSFSYHNGMSFSAKDQDNDLHGKKNCAEDHKGAWWFKTCRNSNLNGLYLRGQHNSEDGVVWYTYKGSQYSLKDTVIKIRPEDFQKKLDYVTPL